MCPQQCVLVCLYLNVFVLMREGILFYFISPGKKYNKVQATTKKLTGPELIKIDPLPSVIQIFVLYVISFSDIY